MKFRRTGRFVIDGECSVDVRDADNDKLILNKALKGEFSEFLPMHVEYLDDEWDFEIMEDSEEFDNDD